MRTMHNLHRIDTAVGEVGMTVRKGDKWADLAAGEIFELCECTHYDDLLNGHKMVHNVVGKGRVEYIYQGQFDLLPAKLIEQEHEKSGRLYSGLLTTMRRAYGESFSEDTQVTVVVYTRIA